jgi:Domain of unknown function (DUF4263)
MKCPEEFQLDRSRLQTELAAFEALLGSPTKELSERNDILPFFKANLAALIGLYNPMVLQPNVLKSELEIFGDCTCDLVVGEKEPGQFCFVEFENANADSLFKQIGAKGMPDWSPRLEHGFSQIIDWFYLLADNQKTQQFRSFFSTDLAHYCGLLVVGRNAFLGDDLQHRLRWRSQNTLIAGRHVHILTFDELLRVLRLRVATTLMPAHAAKPKARKKKL